MEALWFWLLALALTGYVVLDGFDLGAGISALLFARSTEDREEVIRTIGPYWDGNEVWLLVAGGTIFLAFPALYASSFSGFYLPLTIVLWLLMGRGIAIEFRHHVESAVWKPFWGRLFGVSSALLALLFGVALGNVIRGVPLDGSGNFFLPLWTNWDIFGDTGILDWYTVLAGLFAFAALWLHGTLWIWWKAKRPLSENARHSAGLPFSMAGVLGLLVTFASFRIQPIIPRAFAERPWGWIFPILTVAAFTWIFMNVRSSKPFRAFLASSLFLAAMMISVAFGLFPYVLPSNGDPANGLTIMNSAAPEYGLRVGLVWWIPGMLLAVGYFALLFYRFRTKSEQSIH